MLPNRLDIQLRNVCLIFRVYGWLQSLWTPWTPFAPQLSQGTGQGVSMTFNAASRLRSLEDRSAALGSSRCELPGMHSVPKSAVLPYASGVGGLSRRLLNLYLYLSPHPMPFLDIALVSRQVTVAYMSWSGFSPPFLKSHALSQTPGQDPKSRTPQLWSLTLLWYRLQNLGWIYFFWISISPYTWIL